MAIYTENLRTAQNVDSVGAPSSIFEKWTHATNWSGDVAPQLIGDTAYDANNNWIMTGTNAASLTSCLHSTSGGLRLLTAGADNDQVILSPNTTAGLGGIDDVLLSTDKQSAIWFLVTTPSAILTVLYNFGLSLTAVTDITTDADQVKFSFDTDSSDTTWKVNVSIGGTDTELDTGVTVAVSTQYLLGIVIGSDRKARCFVDDGNRFRGSHRVTSGALTTAVDLQPLMAVQALVGAAREIDVKAVALARDW
jgi:hypothetical protein